MTALEIILIILIILFVGGIAGWKIYSHIRKKRGDAKGGGCCDCAGCAHSKNCPSANQSYYGDADDDAMPEVNVQSDVTCDFSDLIG